MANQQLGFDVVGRSNASEVMGQAGKEADKLANKLKKAFDFKSAMAGAFIGAFGAAALLDKGINLITESFKSMADVADQAGKAGISAVEFDKLSFAAKDAGVSTSVLSKAIRELRFMMKDALNDTKKMEQLTKNLGFAEDDVRSGKVKSIDIFNRVAQAIATQTTDTEKLAIATAFFGDKVANDMLPVLEAIAKNPDIFKGLVTNSEEAYAAADKLDLKLQKIWHNLTRFYGAKIVNIADTFENGPVGKGPAIMHIPGIEEGYAKFKANRDKEKGITETQAPALAQVTKAQADAIAASSNKTIKDSNTIGASMGNGPTSGVIGVGNNAMSLIMQDQLDTLKQIKEGIDRLGTPGYMNTDFTKQQYPAV